MNQSAQPLTSATDAQACPTIILVGIDNVVADASRRFRTHPISRSPSKKDFAKLFKDTAQDPPIPDLCALVRQLSLLPNFRIIFCTSRTTPNRKATKAWIHEHCDIADPEILMRPKNNIKSAGKLKNTLLHQLNSAGIKPTIAIESRPTVASMYRNFGLLVLDPGIFHEPLPNPSPPAVQPAFSLLLYPAGSLPNASVFSNTSWLASALRCTPDAIIHPASLCHQAFILHDGVPPFLNHDPKNPPNAWEVSEHFFPEAFALCAARIRSGLPAVLDAGLMRTGARSLAREKMPIGTPINYVIYDQPLETKLATKQHHPDLVRDEHHRFTTQLHNLLAGDHYETNIIIHPDTPTDKFPRKYQEPKPAA